MSVYRPKNSPFYQFDFRLAGVRHRGRTGQRTRRAAEAYEARIRAELAHGRPRLRLTLDEAAGIYFAEVAARQASARTTASQLRTLIAGLGAATPFEDIDQVALSSYVARRRALVANATANREVQLYRRLRKYVAKTHGAAAATDLDFAALQHAEPKERVRELGVEEEARLMAALDPDLAALARFAMISGVRLAGLISLTWSDVDFAGRRITITAKGGGRQAVPLTASALALLANLPRGCEEVFTYALARRTPPWPKGARRPFTHAGWRKRWKAALAEAGIRDFRFHDLRHTAATRLLRATGNLRLVQKLLGHSDIATSARYAHADEADLRAGLDAVEAAAPAVKTREGGT